MMLNLKENIFFDLEQNSGRNTRHKNRVFWVLDFLGFLKILLNSESKSNRRGFNWVRSDFGHWAAF